MAILDEQRNYRCCVTTFLVEGGCLLLSVLFVSSPLLCHIIMAPLAMSWGQMELWILNLTVVSHCVILVGQPQCPCLEAGVEAEQFSWGCES